MPDTLSVIPVVVPADEGVIDAVPAVGVPEQIAEPVPDTGILTVLARPPPVIVMFPLTAPALVGLNLQRTNPGTTIQRQKEY